MPFEVCSCLCTKLLFLFQLVMFFLKKNKMRLFMRKYCIYLHRYSIDKNKNTIDEKKEIFT